MAKRLKASPAPTHPKTGPRTISHKVVNEMITWTPSRNGKLAMCAVTYFEQCATIFQHSKAALNALVGPLQKLENYFAPLGDEEDSWPEDLGAYFRMEVMEPWLSSPTAGPLEWEQSGLAPTGKRGQLRVHWP